MKRRYVSQHDRQHVRREWDMHAGIELLRAEMRELTVTSDAAPRLSRPEDSPLGRGGTIVSALSERRSDGGGNPGVVKVVLEVLTARSEILQ